MVDDGEFDLDAVPTIDDEGWGSTRELIANLRGGIPDCCNFCGKTTEAEKLHPEEAGMWVCEECLARWEKDE